MANKRLSLKRRTSQRVIVVRKIALQARIGGSKNKIVFGVVSNVMVTVLLGTSFIARFVHGVFPPFQKIVLYISRQIVLLAINDLRKERKAKNEKAQHVRTIRSKMPHVWYARWANEDTGKIRNDYNICDTPESSTTDRNTTRVRWYSRLDDSYGQYRCILVTSIKRNCLESSQCPTFPYKIPAELYGVATFFSDNTH